MSRVIFHEAAATLENRGAAEGFQPGHLVDALSRPLRDLRISVTDRCNFRCSYCMPREVFDKEHVFLPQSSLLSFEEITRVARAGVALGIRKFRLTGGEPLMRRHLERLIEQLAQLRTPEGEPVELAMTTNGAMLARKAAALKEAGLHRVTVSLDALDDTLFRQMSDGSASVHDVLEGIEAAANAGLAPVKVNMVVRKGLNEAQILPMARHFRGSGHILRFIEFMDVGNTNGWNLREVVSCSEIHDAIHAEYPLEPVPSSYRGEVAQRWRYVDGAGEIGIISSVTNPFCGDCTRARLSPEGKLFLCLFANRGHDLRTLLRNGASDEALAAQLASIWIPRNDRYSEIRGKATAQTQKIEMSYIGG
ncbi:GTP 3',8-cyclase MoaA [Paracandidimonas soli]|uniref:GTP 3',8-cyclase n=1 Tax=Paracandidimonas soli TaxID=1917182 RepID=A0A4R3VBC6_9BURK|nr:GTP 3',8-cyclase MoaA [Paracandidimonas soli]TCV01361.1 cyclic pyranopterin phosphate synthase [Paracandidimonas soli]